MNKEECMNCEWYGKPYWSIINPCASCNKRFNNKQVKNIKYSINFDKKELYKEIKQLQQENKQLKERIDKAIEYINKLKTYPFLEKYYTGELLKILKGDSNE